MDALLLSVLPVLAAWLAFSSLVGQQAGRGRSQLERSPSSPACWSPSATTWAIPNIALKGRLRATIGNGS